MFSIQKIINKQTKQNSLFVSLSCCFVRLDWWSKAHCLLSFYEKQFKQFSIDGSIWPLQFLAFVIERFTFNAKFSFNTNYSIWYSTYAIFRVRRKKIQIFFSNLKFFFFNISGKQIFLVWWARNTNFSSYLWNFP